MHLLRCDLGLAIWANQAACVLKPLNFHCTAPLSSAAMPYAFEASKPIPCKLPQQLDTRCGGSGAEKCTVGHSSMQWCISCPRELQAPTAAQNLFYPKDCAALCWQQIEPNCSLTNAWPPRSRAMKSDAQKVGFTAGMCQSLSLSLPLSLSLSTHTQHNYTVPPRWQISTAAT